MEFHWTILLLAFLWLLFCEAEGYIDARHMDRPGSSRQTALPELVMFKVGLHIFPLVAGYMLGGWQLALGMFLTRPAIHHGRYFLISSFIDPRKGQRTYWNKPNRVNPFERRFYAPDVRKGMLIIGGAFIAWATFAA